MIKFISKTEFQPTALYLKTKKRYYGILFYTARKNKISIKLSRTYGLRFIFQLFRLVFVLTTEKTINFK